MLWTQTRTRNYTSTSDMCAIDSMTCNNDTPKSRTNTLQPYLKCVMCHHICSKHTFIHEVPMPAVLSFLLPFRPQHCASAPLLANHREELPVFLNQTMEINASINHAFGGKQVHTLKVVSGRNPTIDYFEICVLELISMSMLCNSACPERAPLLRVNWYVGSHIVCDATPKEKP